MKIAYFSLTGQTRRFVKKIHEVLPDVPSAEILADAPDMEMGEPFILIVPTYERNVTDPVWQFMNWAGNSSFCRGIMGGGNRNFAGLFIYTAKDLSADFDVPVLYGFEFNGTHEDVDFVKEWMEKNES